MAFTYDTSLASERDTVRLLLGDKDADAAKFQDEEIDAMLAVYSGAHLTAAALADALSARYAGRASLSVDGFSISSGALADQYAALAARLRALATSSAAGGLGVPLVGGVSTGAMDGVDEDDDRVRPAFEHDMHVNPSPATETQE